MDRYILYSNRNTNVHTFVRTRPDGKESVVSSEEMKNYKDGEHFPDVMDIHHALVRLTVQKMEEWGCVEIENTEAFEGILKVPFEKANEIIESD